MHKLTRPKAPEIFTKAVTEFILDFPVRVAQSEGKRWESFRDTQRNAYQKVRDTLECNQNGLCAYCEIALSDNNKQVEHFTPKILSVPGQDHTLDFTNFLLCCKGGANPFGDAQGGEFSDDPTLADNLSCGQKKADEDPSGRCLNPYELPDFPIFKLDMVGGGRSGAALFLVDTEACQRAGIPPQAAETTLQILGLNCPRLSRRRRTISRSLDKEINTAADEDELRHIAEFHLSPPTSFYTTKLLYLSAYLPESLP